MSKLNRREALLSAASALAGSKLLDQVEMETEPDGSDEPMFLKMTFKDYMPRLTEDQVARIRSKIQEQVDLPVCICHADMDVTIETGGHRELAREIRLLREELERHREPGYALSSGDVLLRPTERS